MKPSIAILLLVLLGILIVAAVKLGPPTCGLARRSESLRFGHFTLQGCPEQ